MIGFCMAFTREAIQAAIANGFVPISIIGTMGLYFLIAPTARADHHEAPSRFGAVYTSDWLKNMAGGIRRAGAYVDNMSLTWIPPHVSPGGWIDLDFLVRGIYNNGQPFSETIVGDTQTVSNIETGVRAFRLFEAWMNVNFGERTGLRLGVYDLNSEFDVLDSSELFMHSAHGVGSDISQSGLNGPSIFPVTGLALRLNHAISDDWTVRIAALDGGPGDPEDPDSSSIQLSRDEGALLVSEFERNTDRSKVLVGSWAYTAQFPQIDHPADSTAVMQFRGNRGAYVRGEIGPFPNLANLSSFARVGIAEGDFNPYSGFFSGGITFSSSIGPFEDVVYGWAFAIVSASSAALRAAEMNDSYISDEEINFEWTISIPLTPRITLQPDVQYIINPGLDPSLSNAFVFGLRFTLNLLDI